MKKLHVGLMLAAISMCLIQGCFTPDLPKLGKEQLVMYGRVNTWAASESNLKKDIKSLRSEDVDGYMIEMMGWANGNAWTDEWIATIDKEYKYLLNLCRDNGKWLFVSIVNDNMGSGKYGDPGIKLSSVMSKAQQLCQIVKKYGKANVLVQPVAEIQTSAGNQFSAYCLSELAGFTMVYNGSGRPTALPGGYSYRAWHPLKITDNPPASTFVVSDTGPIILQLGSGYDGKARPDVLKAWSKRMLSLGCPIVGYYAFKFNGHDADAIEALGKSKE